jgi:hypothetical protein
MLSLALLTSCSRSEPLRRKELSSALHSAASLAAETSFFIAYVSENRATEAYATAHMGYLKQEADRLRQDFSLTGTPSAPALRRAGEQVQALENLLADATFHTHDRAVLAAARRQADEIRTSLETLASSQ